MQKAAECNQSTPDFLLSALICFSFANCYYRHTQSEETGQYYYQGCRHFFSAQHLEFSSENRINTLTNGVGMSELLSVLFTTFGATQKVNTWEIAEEYLIQLGNTFFGSEGRPFERFDFERLKSEIAGKQTKTTELVI